MQSGVVILVAVIGGIAVAVQGQFVGVLDREVGTVASTFITYGSGGLLIGLILLLAGDDGISNWRAVPTWAFLSGVAGIVIIGSISYSVSRIGLLPALMAITVAQFCVSAAVDHFGLLGAEVRPLDVSKVGGLLLLIAGAWLALR